MGLSRLRNTIGNHQRAQMVTPPLDDAADFGHSLTKPPSSLSFNTANTLAGG